MYPFKSLAILILVIVQMKMFPEIGDLLQILQHCFSLWLNLTFAFSQFKANPPAVTFKLTGETDGIFQIQPDGLLYHNKTLDRETRAVHRLQVSWRQTPDTNSNLWALGVSLTLIPSTEYRFHSPDPNDVFAHLICPHFFKNQLETDLVKVASFLGFLTRVTQVILPRLSDGSLIQVRPYLGTWIKTTRHFSDVSLMSRSGCWVGSGSAKKAASVLDGTPLGLARSSSNRWPKSESD